MADGSHAVAHGVRSARSTGWPAKPEPSRAESSRAKLRLRSVSFRRALRIGLRLLVSWTQAFCFCRLGTHVQSKSLILGTDELNVGPAPARSRSSPRSRRCLCSRSSQLSQHSLRSREAAVVEVQVQVVATRGGWTGAGVLAEFQEC